MAFYRQNDQNVWPRNGTAPTRNAYPRSFTVNAPALIPPGMDNPGSTLPSDGFRARPSFLGVASSFGQHDALGGRLMAVSQADTYNAAPNPFPAAGVFDQPGAWHAVLPLIRLQPTTSAHPGLALSTGAGPNMLYTPPPPYSVQTVPIYALGL